MDMEKRKQGRRVRQSVGLLAFLFPSSVPSGFDLEAPLMLEETRERLQKLSHVRVSRSAGSSDPLLSLLSRESQPGTISVAPIEVALVYRDDDTYQYRVDFNDEQFKVRVRGYLKRWEQTSTLVTGSVQVDQHYLGFLFKSLVYTGVAAVLTLLAVVIIQFFGFAPGLLILLQTQPQFLLLFWPVILVGLWLNDVVVPVRNGRNRLVTRIEDMLLFPHLAEG